MTEQTKPSGGGKEPAPKPATTPKPASPGPIPLEHQERGLPIPSGRPGPRIVKK